MAAAPTAPTLRVRLAQSLASPQTAHDAGAELDLPRVEAFRLVYRGIANWVLGDKEAPPRPTPAEEAAAKVLAVRTKGAKPGFRGKKGRAKGNRCEYEPIPA